MLTWFCRCVNFIFHVIYLLLFLIYIQFFENQKNHFTEGNEIENFILKIKNNDRLFKRFQVIEFRWMHLHYKSFASSIGNRHTFCHFKLKWSISANAFLYILNITLNTNRVWELLFITVLNSIHFNLICLKRRDGRKCAPILQIEEIKNFRACRVKITIRTLHFKLL